VLENSTRSIPKATHVPLDIPNGLGLSGSSKLSFVRQLTLQPGEVEKVMHAMGETASDTPTSPTGKALVAFLRPFERSTATPIPLPSTSAFVGISAQTLLTFGSSL